MEPLIKTSDKCHSLYSEYSPGSSALSIYLYWQSICFVCPSVLSVYLYCQCQPILSFLLNGLSVRLSCLMSDNLSCLVSLFYLIVCLSVFSMSVCLYCQCQSNYYFLPKWHVCLSVFSVYLYFSLCALLVHGIKGSWLKVSEL